MSTTSNTTSAATTASQGRVSATRCSVPHAVRRGAPRGGTSVQIGFVRLGRTGGDNLPRLLDRGHEVVAYDRSEEARLGAVPSTVGHAT